MYGPLSTKGRHYFEGLRRVFEHHHANESYLPTPFVLKLNPFYNYPWICYRLVSPELRTLEMQHYSDSNHRESDYIAITTTTSTTSTISTLSIRAPQLNELRLDGEIRGILNSASVSGLKHLKCFQSDQSIDNNVLQSLASLPHLVKLGFHLSSEFLPVPPGSSSAQTPFPSLQSLQITAGRLPLLAHFIQCYIQPAPAPIQDLEFTIDWRKIQGCHTPPETPLRGLDIFLSAGGFEQRLTALFISGHTDLTGHNPAPPSLNFRDITPLLQCAGLQYFTIDADYSLEGFKNSAIEEMAAAWPQLRSLQLISYSRSQPMSCTILCLRHFARCCPDLQHIKLSFSPTPCGKIRRAGPRAIQSSMESLDVGYSPLEFSDVPVVAAFLARLFPNLDGHGMGYRNFPDHENGRSWKAVSRLLREIHERKIPDQD